MLSRRITSVASILRSSYVKSVYTATNRGFLIRPSSAVCRYATSSDQNSTASRSAPDTHFVTPLDRITLILTRTMKSEDIKAEVSPGTMDKANNRRRIGINLVLVLITLISGVWIIKKSQKGREEHTLVSLHEQNIQRYKKLREEEAAAAAAAAELKK